MICFSGPDSLEKTMELNKVQQVSLARTSQSLYYASMLCRFPKGVEIIVFCNMWITEPVFQAWGSAEQVVEKLFPGEAVWRG